MSESIYAQLEKGKIITPVAGKDYETILPSAIFPTATQFGDKEKLVAWANENDFTYELIQKGLQKAIIEVRAVYKATKKDVAWNEIAAQANIDKMTWDMVEKPNQGGSGKAISTARYNDCLGMIGNLAAAKMDKGAIRLIVVPIYGDDMVSEVFAALEKAAN